MATEIERGFEVGQDAYGRRVTLARRRKYDGKVVWGIVTHPDSQRDDGEKIDSLSDDNLRQIAEAFASVR